MLRIFRASLWSVLDAGSPVVVAHRRSKFHHRRTAQPAFTGFRKILTGMIPKTKSPTSLSIPASAMQRSHHERGT
uniref:Putative secreted protein n=1 Tax=Ixodes ricinus TaxID=34613 RepID=A0A6B0U4R1_IXORI